MIVLLAIAFVTTVIALVWLGMALFQALILLLGIAGAMAAVGAAYLLLTACLIGLTLRRRKSAGRIALTLNNAADLIPALADVVESLAKQRPYEAMFLSGLGGFLAVTHPDQAVRILSDLIASRNLRR